MQHKRLSALLFFWLFLWSSLAPAVPPNQKPTIWACDPGTIAHNCARMGVPVPQLAMPFWENAGSIFDTILSRNAPLTGATWQSGSLYFGGDGDRCVLSNTTGINFTKNFTCIITFKTTQNANYCHLINKYNPSSPNQGWGISVHGGTIRFYSDLDGNWREGGIVNNGEKRQVAIVQRNTAIDFYIDGKFDTQHLNAECSDNSAYAMSFGAVSTGTYPFDGNIYEIILFDQILNASQIQTINNNRYGMFEPIRWPIWSYSGAAGEVIVPIFLYHYMHH